MKFNRIIAIVPLALSALIILFAPQKYVWLAIIPIAIVCLYLAFIKTLDYFINDGKLLWLYARKTPMGRSELPQWNSLDRDFRNFETYKHLYFWIVNINGIRTGVCLNSHIEPQTSVINKIHRKLSNDLSVADWRDLVIKEAFDMRGRQTEQEKIDDLRKKGYKVEAPRARKEILPQNEE